LKLNVKIDDNYDVFADKNMLMTVVRNIISNAIKYTPRKGKIEVEVQRDSQFYKVVIKDSGVGFDKKLLQKFLIQQVFIQQQEQIMKRVLV
jgi:signal transduction histidine kinase